MTIINRTFLFTFTTLKKLNIVHFTQHQLILSLLIICTTIINSFIEQFYNI